MAQDLLTFAFYPSLALAATCFLYVIGDELEKIRKK
jgi:hypothetical protein